MTAATAAPAIGERTAALLPVHLFGNPAPMDELRELAAERGLTPGRGRRAGGRRAARRPAMAGRAGRRRRLQLLPVQEPRRLRRRRRGRHRRRRGRGRGPAPALPWLRGQAAAHRGRLQLAPRRAAGRRRCGCCFPISTGGRPRAARPPPRTRASGLGELVELPAETEGAESCYHLYVVRSPERDACRRALPRQASRPGPTTRRRFTGSRRCSRGPAARCRRPSAPREESLALPMGPALGGRRWTRSSAVDRRCPPGA